MYPVALLEQRSQPVSCGCPHIQPFEEYHWGIGGHQHLVDHVNDAVAGVHVGKGHVCPVDLHAVPDGKGKGLSVYSLSRHAVGESGGWNIACDDVVEQNGRQRRLAFRRVEGREVDTCVSKGLAVGAKTVKGPGP